MASLAGMLQARGHRVTGSDENVYPPMSTMLESLGIGVMQGYRAENLNLAVGSERGAEGSEALGRKQKAAGERAAFQILHPTPHTLHRRR